MKKRLIALLLVAVLLIPAGIASAATWYRVNTSSVKVRFLNSESANVLASYRRDYAATVNKFTDDGWAYVTFSNGFQGYVQKKYLTKGKSYGAWVAYDDTALRVKPEGTGSAKATLAKGTKVTVLTHGSNYDYVSVKDFGTGYIVNSRLSKKKVAASGSESKSTAETGGGYYAWVNIAGGRTVNLRNNPSENAPVIKTYGTGTKVYVVEHSNTWDKVQVDGQTGWIKTQFLFTNEPAPTATPAPSGQPGGGGNGYTAYVYTGNKKPVNARKGNSTNYSVQFKVPYGAPVLVLKHEKTWDYIQYNGKKGYVQNKYLQLSKPSDAGEIITQDPSVTITPAPAFQPYDATVTVDNLNFHRQKGDWSSNVNGVGRLQAGYPVKVLKIEGGWAQVEYMGYKGWVHKQYISP